MKKCLVLIDGQNLRARYNNMLDDKHKPHDDIIHTKDYVWSPRVLTEVILEEPIHFYYYSIIAGSDEHIKNISNEISRIEVYYRGRVGDSTIHRSTLSPQIFKTEKNSYINKSADDIHLTLDALRHSYNRSIESIMLFSGDGDFVPVIKEVMRQGVRVWVCALSKGCSPELESVADRFYDIDYQFFRDIPKTNRGIFT